MADTKEQEPKVVGAADPGATPRGEEPKVAPDPAAPPKGKEPKPKKPKKGPGGEARPAEPEGPPPEPAPPPRLHEYYDQRVRPKLAQQFGFKNAHEIPKLVKIVLNVGMGDAPKNPKGLEAAVAELAAITGQHPGGTGAKKSIAHFHLREGMAVGCAVTLGGAGGCGVLGPFIRNPGPALRAFPGPPG